MNRPAECPLDHPSHCQTGCLGARSGTALQAQIPFRGQTRPPISVTFIGQSLLCRAVESLIREQVGQNADVSVPSLLSAHSGEEQETHRGLHVTSEGRAFEGSVEVVAEVYVFIASDSRNLQNLLDSREAFLPRQGVRAGVRIVVISPVPLSDSANGIPLPSWFKEYRPIYLTLDAEPADLVNALTGINGINGLNGLIGAAPAPEMAPTIDGNRKGGSVHSPIPGLVKTCVREPAIPAQCNDSPTDKLSSREKELAYLAVAGLSNAEIADYLHLKLPTVKWHFQSIFTKLGIQRRTQLPPHAKYF